MRSLALAVVSVGLVVCGCSASGPAPDGRVRVVAAENFWGSIASQLGGDRVDVTSVVSSPATDPHDYEPTAADARAMAVANLVIENGVGYDPWAPKLVAANPVSGRLVLDVGKLVGVRAGGNPHRWYSPADVERVIAAITSDYKRLDRQHARYFDAQRRRFETSGLPRYRSLIASIRARFAGTAVGASESIFVPMAQALGLRLLTPLELLNAVSEGTDPTAAAKSAADSQIARRLIRIWVYNGQNATPDVTRLTDAARARGIPVVTITETLAPKSSRFQDWQVSQLARIEQALAKATHR